MYEAGSNTLECLKIQGMAGCWCKAANSKWLPSMDMIVLGS